MIVKENPYKKIFGAGVIAIDKNTGKILFGRRGLKGDQGGTWAPFGGTFEEKKDKTPKCTAIREFREESGCSVKYLISKKPFYINRSNTLDFYSYIGVFDGQFPVRINKESLDFEWFDLNNLPQHLHSGVEEMLEKLSRDKAIKTHHEICKVVQQKWDGLKNGSFFNEYTSLMTFIYALRKLENKKDVPVLDILLIDEMIDSFRKKIYNDYFTN